MERKFFFDRNVFDAPHKEGAPDAPPPPPTFSEDELSGAKDMAFEQGRQQGQREEKATREQHVANTLTAIADNFSRLFAAETIRENVFEKEALKLSIAALDLLHPLLTEKIGPDAVRAAVQKTLSDHRKTKEINIFVPAGMKGEIESLITHIREGEHNEVLWRVREDTALTQGDCRLEWSDGGAVRDSVRAARDIRKSMEALLGAPQDRISESDASDISLALDTESPPPPGPENEA